MTPDHRSGLQTPPGRRFRRTGARRAGLSRRTVGMIIWKRIKVDQRPAPTGREISCGVSVAADIYVRGTAGRGGGDMNAPQAAATTGGANPPQFLARGRGGRAHLKVRAYGERSGRWSSRRGSERWGGPASAAYAPAAPGGHPAAARPLQNKFAPPPTGAAMPGVRWRGPRPLPSPESVGGRRGRARIPGARAAPRT